MYSENRKRRSAGQHDGRTSSDHVSVSLAGADGSLHFQERVIRASAEINVQID